MLTYLIHASSMYCLKNVNPLCTGNPKTGTLANIEDTDEMLHNAALLFAKTKNDLQ